MKRRFITRAVAMLSVSAIAVSAVSCGKGKGDKKDAQTADQVIANSYSSEKMGEEIKNEIGDISGLTYIPDTGKILITSYSYSEAGESKIVLFSASHDLTDFDKFEIPQENPKNGSSNMITALSSDGNIWALYCITDYGDYQLPDFDDPDFDWEHYDYEEQMKHAKFSYKLKKFSFEGEELSSCEINGFDEYIDGAENGVYIDSINETGSGDILLKVNSMMETNLIITPEGECRGKIELDEMSVYYTTAADDGRIAISGYEDGKTVLRYIDPETLQPDGDAVAAEEFNSGFYSLIKGSGEYNLLFVTSRGLCGVTKDGKVKEIINWVDSDLAGDNVRYVTGMDDGRYLIYYNTYGGSDSETGFYMLSPRDKDEFKDTKIIKVALMYSGSDVTSVISEFNRQNNGYRITVDDYSKYNEYDEKTETMVNSADKQLKLDIVSGKSPDMIVTYNHSTISELSSKGVFADLYPILENSDKLSKEDILPNVLKANEINGKLYSLAPSFNIRTFAAKSEFIDRQGWTLDDLIETYEKYKGKMNLTQTDSKESIMSMLLYQCSDFVDYEKAECHFDSPDFIKLIEFCNQFPNMDDVVDYDNMSDDEWQKYYEEIEASYRNNKTLLCEMYMSSPGDYIRESKGRFGADITLVGYPNAGGTGAAVSFDNYFAILDSSPSKDQCWEFISSFFDKEFNRDKMYNFPSTISAFEQCMAASMEKPYYMDENNEKVYYDDTYYIGGNEIKLDPLTQKEVDFISDFIKNTDAIYGEYSEEVTSIIQEEVKAYFAGEKSSNEAAGMIQNRVSLLISEQS